MNSSDKYDFLGAVYEAWTAWEGTEWGDQMRALSAAYNMGEDYAGFSSEEMDALGSVLRYHVCDPEMQYSYVGAQMGGDPFYIHETRKAIRETLRLREVYQDQEGFAEIDVPEWMQSEEWIDEYVKERPYLLPVSARLSHAATGLTLLTEHPHTVEELNEQVRMYAELIEDMAGELKR